MNINNHSLGDIFRYVLGRFLHTEWHKLHYLAKKLDEDFVNSKMKGFDLDVKELQYSDFLKGDPNVFKGDKMELYKERCQDPNYKAYGIFENDKLIYSAWISLKKFGLAIESKPILLAKDEGYLEDAHCDPLARGRGFHSKMNNYRIQQLFKLGKKVAVVTVREGNIPALKVQAKSGMVDLGYFYIGRILGVNFCTLNKEKFDKIIQEKL